MEKKMDMLTKAKLIYSCEIGIFAIAFIVLAVLRATGVIPPNETRLAVFNWITLFGGTWLIVDFFWALLDKKRQKRISLVDKCLHLPVGPYLITFDLYCLITKPAFDGPICKYGVPIALAYLGLCYAFEAVYHYFYPLPSLLDAVNQDENQVVSEQDAEILEDNKEENASKENNNE